MTISTTYFRENLVEIIHKAANEGESVVLVFSKGKSAKK